MSEISGECFIAFTSNSETKSVIFGRNSLEAEGNIYQEVHYYAGLESLINAPSDEINGGKYAIILQKPSSIWGGDYGANERDVCVGISWSNGESESATLQSTDFVRIVLATAATAKEAVDRINTLVSAHGADTVKLSFVVCDPNEAWLVSIAGKAWVGQCVSEGIIRAASDGLAVTTTIDQSSPNLNDTLKTLGLWNGEGDLNFAECFGAFSNQSLVVDGIEEVNDVKKMFEILRSNATDATRSATASVLTTAGMSCHWFTATPNPRESVFKPFVFSLNPKISPLTKLMPDGNITLLHKLHAQRKPMAIEDLKNLEDKCVDEVNKHLQENPTPSEELDELMKDCVEAEVKFYR